MVSEIFGSVETIPSSFDVQRTKYEIDFHVKTFFDLQQEKKKHNQKIDIG